MRVLYSGEVLCSIVFFLRHSRTIARLNIMTLTGGRSTGAGTEALSPTFDIALEDMAVKYPVLFKDYQQTRLDLIGELNATVADLQYDLLQRL